MQSKKTKQIKFKESKELHLYSIDGEIITLKEFLKKNLDLLSQFEKKFVEKQIDDIKEEKIPVNILLSRTKRFFNGEKVMPALRGGTRSAYIKGNNLKVKGCRPEDSKFPHWKIDNDFNLIVDKVPFGVLTRRTVIGEILAYLFMRKNNIESSSNPICVFHYKPNGKNMNYALLQKIDEDNRLETFIDCDSLSVHDVIRLKKKRTLLGEEVDLKGINRKDYLRKKVELLIKFNFCGGFRGILNSNIGNDVIRNNKLHSICDFDSFTIREIPKQNDKQNIRHFTISAFIELIKTSLPFIDYLDLGGHNQQEMHQILSDYYRKNSSLYSLYHKSFLNQAQRLNWDLSIVESCVEEAFLTSLSFELLQELIPNSHTFKSYNYDFVYVPHN